MKITTLDQYNAIPTYFRVEDETHEYYGNIYQSKEIWQNGDVSLLCTRSFFNKSQVQKVHPDFKIGDYVLGVGDWIEEPIYGGKKMIIDFCFSRGEITAKVIVEGDFCRTIDYTAYNIGTFKLISKLHPDSDPKAEECIKYLEGKGWEVKKK